MSSSAENILRTLRPATRIVVVGHGDHTETPSGHVETSKDTIVCYRDGEPHRLEVLWTQNFLSGGGISHGKIVSDEVITDAEYAAAASGRPPVDTPALLARVEQKRLLGEAFNADRPSCPKCDAPMRLKAGKFGRFWGCRNYDTRSRCDGTRKRRARDVQRLEEAERLGGPFLE